MMQMRVLAGVLVAGVALSGCNWLTGEEGVFRDRGDEYRKAQSIPAMKPPEGKQASAVEDLYAIPVERTDVLLGSEFEVPRPTPLASDAEQGVVRIQKLDDDQWILLDGAPSEVWPRVRAFLISNQIGIEREEASSGVLETGWLSFKSEQERRERYRFRVEQGVQRASTEVYVTQSGYSHPEGEEVTPPEWTARSENAERETFMLKELAGYLADTSDAGSVSLLAQGISTTNKVYVIRDASGRPAIDLRLPFERAWASLGRALPRAEFNVRDLDRSAGVFFVSYEPGSREEEEAAAADAGEEGTQAKGKGEDEDGRGFFSGMFDWWGDEENPATGRNYRVEMKQASEGVTIGVLREDGSDFEEGELEFLLGLIRAHLA